MKAGQEDFEQQVDVLVCVTNCYQVLWCFSASFYQLVPPALCSRSGVPILETGRKGSDNVGEGGHCGRRARAIMLFNSHRHVTIFQVTNRMKLRRPLPCILAMRALQVSHNPSNSAHPQPLLVNQAHKGSFLLRDPLATLDTRYLETTNLTTSAAY